MSLDELIDKLKEVKENHEYYGKLKIVRVSKKDNQQELVDVELKIRNMKFLHDDAVILKFE